MEPYEQIHTSRTWGFNNRRSYQPARRLSADERYQVSNPVALKPNYGASIASEGNTYVGPRLLYRNGEHQHAVDG